MTLARRTTWGLLDQGLSSATNFALSLLVARAVAPREFGAFSVAYGVYTVAAGVGQAVCAQPYQVRFTTAAPEAQRRAAGAATAAAVMAGGAFAVVVAAAGMLIGGALREPFLWLALFLPALLAQDAWRFIFVADGRPRAAAANDALWAVMQIVGITGAHAVGVRTVGAYLGIWGGSAGVAAIFGCWQARNRPRYTTARGWWLDQRDLATRYAAEQIVVRGATLGVLAIVAGVLGLSAAGAIRGAQVVFGLLNLLWLGALLVIVAEGRRLLDSDRRQFARLMLVVSVASAAAAVLWAVVALLLPGSFGRALLGGTWDVARPVLLPIALHTVVIGASIGAQSGLKSLGSARRSLRAHLAGAACLIAGGFVGAAVGRSAVAAATGMALGGAFAMCIWWGEFLAGLREPSDPADATKAHEDAVVDRASSSLAT